MSLAKYAIEDLDGESIPYDLNDLKEVDDIELPEIEVEEEPEIEVEEEPLDFTLPLIPGAEDQDEIEELSVEEPKEDIKVESDPNSWTIATFLPWMHKKMTVVPKHSGKDTLGIERMIAYFKSLKNELSKAARMDLTGSLDIGALEKIRDEIENAISRGEERLEQLLNTKYKKKKKADSQPELVKEAQKSASFTVNVPYTISALARVCINSTVSGGHDMEQTLIKLDKKYKLDDREKLQLMFLLSDMGYPVRRDRGFMFDEPIDQTSSDGFDWNGTFPG